MEWQQLEQQGMAKSKLLNALSFREAQDFRTAYRTTRVLLGCLSINMTLQAIFIAHKVFQVMAVHSSSDSTLTALFGCYLLWIISSTVGGTAGMHAALSGSAKTAKICMTGWICMIVAQVLETTISVVFIPRGNVSPSTAHMLVLDTIALCFIELIFVAFIKLHLHVREGYLSHYPVALHTGSTDASAYQPLLGGDSVEAVYLSTVQTKEPALGEAIA